MEMDIELSTLMFLRFVLVLVLLCRKNGPQFVSGDGDKVMCRDNEREALLTFKQRLVNVDDVRLLSWNSEERNKECCEWWGVHCSSRTGHVVALDLQFYALGGEISSALLELSRLYYLDLSGIDFERKHIPEFIGSFKKLKYLYLGSSNFSGEVPYQLGHLTNLRTLDLGDNCLTLKDLSWLSNLSSLSQLDLSWNQYAGVVPTSIFQLPDLQRLDVSHNFLNGRISEVHFSKLHALKYLDLSFNSLTLHLSPGWVPPFQLDSIILAGCRMGPRFPTWLQTQSNFSVLDLSSTGISDQVPNWLWDLSHRVMYFNLSYNQISGSIHDLSKFSDIIDISSNNFSGPLPLFHPKSTIIHLSKNMFGGSIRSICRVKYDRLYVLDLSSNQFSEELPVCWGDMRGLRVVSLADNKFSGHLPRSIGSSFNLETLHFRNNNLTGELPSTLKNCKYLQLIDGGGNELTGNVPTWIGTLTMVAFLILRHNNFHGSIPPEICHLQQIQVLDLSHNTVSGRIPPCFQNFTSLVLSNRSTVTYQGLFTENALVQWKRQESQYTNTLKLLKLIDLSSNKLVGSIPPKVSKLAGLASLNLSRNYLTGGINSDIDQMKMLESLDLSRNKLSGEIPNGLAELHYLAILDLSSNNLWGKIPQSTQLQSFDASAYAENNELCGRPLPNCLGDDPRPNKRDTDDHKNEGINIIQSEYFVSAVLGYVVGFWVVIGPLAFKRSWSNSYFAYLTDIGDWLYVTIATCTTRLR